MLLTKEDYIQLFENAKTPQSNGTLLCYILDETQVTTDLINKIAKAKNLVPFKVNSKVENKTAPLKDRVQPPVEQWLRGFFDAEFIITDSFHACIFSILFNKQFVVIGNIDRGLSRIKSLLSIFSLENQLITACKSLEISLINYNKENEKLTQLRGQCFLKETILL